MPEKKQPDINHQHFHLDLWGNKNEFHWKEFKVARDYVRSLNLTDHAGWEELVSKRKLHRTNIPSNPDEVYKNHGWKGWGDWLGSSKKDEVRTESSELNEITIECRCKVKIEHCPVCDGKGYYYRKI